MTDSPPPDKAAEPAKHAPDAPTLGDVEGVVDFTPPEDSPDVPPPTALLAEVVGRFPGVAWDSSCGQDVIVVAPDLLLEVGEWLRDEAHFDMCVDVTAVDYLDHWDRGMGGWTGERTRYEVVVNILDLGDADRAPRRLRIRVPVEEEEGTCPSLAFVWPLADPAEREIYDLYGIVFEGHPDLTRILMPDDWEGHPLRKDYSVSRIPVTFTGDTERPATTPIAFGPTRSGPRDEAGGSDG